MLKMEHRATFHPTGLGGIPSTEAQSAPSPNVAVSHEPAVNHIHEPPGYKQSCLCALVHSVRRSLGRGQGPGCGGAATASNHGALPRVEQGSGVAGHLANRAAGKCCIAVNGAKVPRAAVRIPAAERLNSTHNGRSL